MCNSDLAGHFVCDVPDPAGSTTCPVPRPRIGDSCTSTGAVAACDYGACDGTGVAEGCDAYGFWATLPPPPNCP